MELTADPLLAILDKLHVGLAVVDGEDRIVLMNRRFGEMVQEVPAERVGTSIFLCHPPESRAAVEKLMDDLRTGLQGHAENWVNFRGRIIYEFLYPIWDAKGNFVGIADELLDAADRAEHIKMRGEWRDLPVSGEGARAPRPVSAPA